MILSKASRLTLLAGLLCLLLTMFTGASYAQNFSVRWDVFPSPTEVINTGRSEVLGSVTFIVQAGQVAQNGGLPLRSGNSAGGPTQIGILYNQLMMIDNGGGGPFRQDTSGITTTGVRVFAPKFASAGAADNTKYITFTVTNIDITGTGQFAGLITLNIPGGVSLVDGDAIRLDGVRGRIDRSQLSQAGTDAFVRIQSIDDPAANQFFPDTIRVATSFLPLTVSVTSNTAVLCLQPFGAPLQAFLAGHKITVKENFTRAFVAKDSGTTNLTPNTSTGPAGAGDSTDRLDSYRDILGAPTNGTKLKVGLNSIPAVVTGVSWPATVNATVGGGFFVLQDNGCSGNDATKSPCFTAGTAGANPAAGNAFAIYEYFTNDQSGSSDTTLESFDFMPELTISGTNQMDIGQNAVRAGVSLWPPPALSSGSGSSFKAAEPSTGLYPPFSTANAADTIVAPAMPRFLTIFQSGTVQSSSFTDNTATTSFGIYEQFAPCVCYLMFPFTTSWYTTANYPYDTGLSVANTSDDTGAIPTAQGAAKQAGTVTFYLYDFQLGAITPTGVFFKDVAHTALPGSGLPAFTTATPPQPIYYAGQSARGTVSELASNTAVAATLVSGNRPDFTGYIIARANFQYCHGFAFIADNAFGTIAHGYVANVIPDPSIKGGSRQASAAADVSNGGKGLPAGESLNN